MEKAPVQVFEHGIKIVNASLRRMQLLAPAHLTHQMRLAHYFAAGHIFSIAGRVAAIDRLAVHLGQQDVSDGAHHRLRRALQQIGKPHQQPALAQSNGVVYVGEGEEFDLQLRRRSARTQLPVFILENLKQSLTHSEPRLARSPPPSGCRNLTFGGRLHRNRKPDAVHSDLLPDGFASDFFLCLAASSCSAKSLRWSSAELSTVSRALVRTNSYRLASSARTLAASRKTSSLAWNSVSASMMIFSGLRISFLRST